MSNPSTKEGTMGTTPSVTSLDAEATAPVIGGLTFTFPEETVRALLAAATGQQATELATAGEYARVADAVRPDREAEREHRDLASHHVERAEQLQEAIETFAARLNHVTRIELALVAA